MNIPYFVRQAGVPFTMRRLWFRGLNRIRQSSPPGMITVEEQRFLHDFGRSYHSDGALVDLGSFLGASVAALASGLADPRRIHAYDLFRWEPFMESALPGATYRVGDSFVDAFQRNVEQWAWRIEIHAGDVTALGWHGGPIGFLFVDAMKSWGLMNSIARDFFPSLETGATVVHQDFAHHHTSWIHVQTYRLRDSLRSVGQVPRSGSHVFRVAGPIPAWAPIGPSDVSRAELDAAFDYSLSLVPGEERINILAAKVDYLLRHGDPDDAERTFRAIAKTTPVIDDLFVVRRDWSRIQGG